MSNVPPPRKQYMDTLLPSGPQQTALARWSPAVEVEFMTQLSRLEINRDTTLSQLYDMRPTLVQLSSALDVVSDVPDEARHRLSLLQVQHTRRSSVLENKHRLDTNAAHGTHSSPESKQAMDHQASPSPVQQDVESMSADDESSGMSDSDSDSGAEPVPLTPSELRARRLKALGFLKKKK